MFLSYINSQYPNIKFTVELENDDSIPFLNVLVTHNNLGLYRNSLYRKKTYTCLHSDFDSLDPDKY